MCVEVNAPGPNTATYKSLNHFGYLHPASITVTAAKRSLIFQLMLAGRLSFAAITDISECPLLAVVRSPGNDFQCLLTRKQTLRTRTPVATNAPKPTIDA